MNKRIEWESPSNIAIIKYWGKKEGRQLPANPSVSFTLSKCKTITRLTRQPQNVKRKTISLEYFFEDERHEDFENKILRYFELLSPTYPFLQEWHFRIESRNTFPHSAGIASSASSMSALALCLVDLERELMGKRRTHEDFLRWSSLIARLGSGSASRSLFPYAALWGQSPWSCDEYAVEIRPLHPVFKSYRDSILLVSQEPKKISSREGHALMNHHPYRDKRYQLAKERTLDIFQSLKLGDEDGFGDILEQEALELHALMGSSRPPIFMMQRAVPVIIKKVRDFRQETKVPLYFTLDAGTNIHLLYPERAEKRVREFMSLELKNFLQEPYWIHDRVGLGPRKLL